jgi:glucose-1-phosphate adenylyltransferase
VVNRQEPTRLTTGITLVGKRAIVPRGTRIGRNCKVAENVRATDFRSRVVRSGGTVEAHRDVARVARVAPAAARRPGRPAAV